MEIIQAIILGIVEGLTEFLPISSTGHLIVAENAMSFKDTAELFTVVIQFGAIAAVIWYYRHDLKARIKALLNRRPGTNRFWFNILLATIPAGLVGLMLESSLEKYSKTSTVAWMLILGGLVLWAVESRRRPDADRPRARGHADEARLDSITPKQALGVGVAQVTSLVPGVSRAGATIVGGLLSGLDRVTATAFSFYLSIPIIVLASSYKLIKHHGEIPNLPGGSLALLFGTLAAFVTALITVSWLLRYISRNDFKPFAYYRIVFGVFLLLLLWLNFL